MSLFPMPRDWYRRMGYNMGDQPEDPNDPRTMRPGESIQDYVLRRSRENPASGAPPSPDPALVQKAILILSGMGGGDMMGNGMDGRGWMPPRAGRQPIPGGGEILPVPLPRRPPVQERPRVMERTRWTPEEEDFLRRNPGDEHRIPSAFGYPQGK